MSYAPAPVIEGKARLPLPFGMFSVLDDFRSTESIPHSENGVQWQTLGCGPASGIGDPSCNTTDNTTQAAGLPKYFAPGIPVGQANAFRVYGSHQCALMGRGEDAITESEDYAKRQLLAREEARVERAFWQGDLGNTATLKGAVDLTSTTPGPGAASPVVALSTLENWLSKNYGSLGIIHMSRGSMDVLGSNNHIVIRDGKAYTFAGTRIIAGAGYDGTGPAGQVPPSGTEWVYATPMVWGLRSDPFVSSAPDYRNNNVMAVAERTYVLAMDPCGVACVQYQQTCC